MLDLELISFLSFWSDCGVDCSYEETSQDRLRPPVRPVPESSRTSRYTDPRPVEPEQDAAATASGAATLEALEAAIASFDGCPLKAQGAARSVFYRGRSDAPIMIIGEAPGGEEDRLGQPFVGPAGRLLDRMLAAASLEDKTFITNTVFWRPPGNRTPTLQEQAVCRPFVEQAIRLVAPRLLVFAGGAAAKSMLQTTEGILTLRGRWTEWRSTAGDRSIPALPILHPSFLLRQPIAKKKAWSDLLSLSRRLAEESLEGIGDDPS